MIGAVEQAIIDRLQAAEASLGYRWGAVGSYAGELDDNATALVANGRFPAAWAVYTGRQRAAHPKGDLWRVGFTVVVAADGGRNEQERRHGAAGRVGAYQLVDDIIDLLDGQTLGLDIVPVEVTGDRTLFNGTARSKRLAVYAIDLTTGWLAEPPVDAATLDDFATFHAEWDIPPHRSADEPDAVDHIQLPIQEDAQ